MNDVDKPTLAPYRWIILAVTMLAGFIGSYAQFQLPPLAYKLMPALNLSTSQFAALMGGPMTGSIFICLVGGTLADRCRHVFCYGLRNGLYQFSSKRSARSAGHRPGAGRILWVGGHTRRHPRLFSWSGDLQPHGIHEALFDPGRGVRCRSHLLVLATADWRGHRHRADGGWFFAERYLAVVPLHAHAVAGNRPTICRQRWRYHLHSAGDRCRRASDFCYHSAGRLKR
jgi:hypothetical protein